MTTLLISDPVFIAHAVPEGHPERPDRMRAVAAALSAAPFDALKRRAPQPAPDTAITAVHPPAYLEALRAASPREGHAYLDADTPIAPRSIEVAQLAVGAALQAVDAVVRGEADNAFVAARPPGHHAEAARAMGFCLFNAVAIAARHAQAAHGLQRVAIVDFDVHHGNGTQAIFWNAPDVLFASTHQMPLYPGSGHVIERGEHDQIVNVPLRAGDDGRVFLAALREKVLPALEAHGPDLILVSAGFDAHRRDPLANLALEAEDFAAATEELMGIAARHCGGRLVSLLEGGYDLEGLSSSVAAHVKTLMGA